MVRPEPIKTATKNQRKTMPATNALGLSERRISPRCPAIISPLRHAATLKIAPKAAQMRESRIPPAIDHEAGRRFL
jgi:hypothetical protein